MPDRDSASTRRRLLDAARSEFAFFGFDGASTRRIAEAAGSHQPQVNYFFGSKGDLWREVLRDVYRGLEAAMSDVDRFAPPSEVLADVLRRFVTFAHRHPELHQILFHEFAAATERLDWVVSEFTGPAFDDFHRIWDAAIADGSATPIDARVAFHTFVGAASLLPVARSEAALQMGEVADADDLVHAHTESIVALFVPGAARRRTTPITSLTTGANA